MNTNEIEEYLSEIECILESIKTTNKEFLIALKERKAGFKENKESLIKRSEERLEYAMAVNRFSDVGFFEDLILFLKT
ncbi:MAG: hypothetical protein KAT04_15445 [Methylococcales bacterium]|nr:hypothetical protein [Methylococcales bacterium]